LALLSDLVFPSYPKGADLLYEEVESLLNQLTLNEKVALLAGSDMWHSTPIKRLGIPSIKVSDGPNGVRGAGGFLSEVTAACFPVGIALAATWNTTLIEQVGQALAQEAKTKQTHVLLAPTVNIHRSPLNGRNFECFSEDPYLTSRIAVAYIGGVQSQGVGATIKHFVCNDSEFQRTSISSQVNERALREIYLMPFQVAVQEVKPWAVMASYNKINGTYASENFYTLTEILRKEWGFEGLVMSDWYGTKSTAASVKAGLDLEMPGPAKWRGQKLLQALENDEIDETIINQSVRRVLELIAKSGDIKPSDESPELAVNTPEHRALAREVAAEAIVLLKNEGNILPLQPETLTSLAIIGPNAKTAQIMAGGSAQLNPHYAITPYDGIVARLGDKVKVEYEIGCTNHKYLPLIDPSLLHSKSGETQSSFRVEYFDNLELSGDSVWTTSSNSSELMWSGDVPGVSNSLVFSARSTGYFTPSITGTYTFGLLSAGLSRLYFDGQEVIDNWTHQTFGDLFFGLATIEITYTVQLVAGQEYTLVLEYSKNANDTLGAIRLGCNLPTLVDRLERARQLAASSEVALVFAGLSGEWESEGFDRPNMELPQAEVELIEEVAAANKNTIVVLNTGSPIAMPWLDKVAGVVQAWYPGQESGNAISDVLFGDVNPSGKLPQTFPIRLEDNPAYLNYPGENGKVHYGEGLYVGYRYYDKKKITPLFPFGFGLSYTTFSYGPLKLSSLEISPDDTLGIAVDITNIGLREGKEIVQLYLRDVKSSLHRPEKELKAFAKVQLASGESQTVTLELNPTALAYYDDLARNWVAEAGQFEVLVGSSSRDIWAEATFTLNETRRWPS
jgi:beta-glucosidase